MSHASLSISILGLGAMGVRMARRLVDAGHDVTVYNRSASRAAPLLELGARLASTPRVAAAGADVVLAMVRDDRASQAVWTGADGAVHGLHAGAIAIESSTLSPDWVMELASTVVESGARFLDAPVVGTRPHAEQGALRFLVGGDAETMERARPVLDVLGSEVHHAGPTPAGTRLKLAVNASFAIQVAALSELLGSLIHQGVEERTALGILSAMPTTSPALRGVGAGIESRHFAPLFPVELVEKELGYALSAAPEPSRLPTTAAVRAVVARAGEQGLAHENLHAVAKLYLP